MAKNTRLGGPSHEAPEPVSPDEMTWDAAPGEPLPELPVEAYGPDAEPLELIPERARPADSAVKAEWVAYALAVDPDLTAAEAEAMTKGQLQAEYG